MDSDEVNSIGDTPESLQVANIVRSTWDDIVARLDLPEHYSLLPLTAIDVDHPTVMTRPAAFNSILWIKYDRQTAADPVPLWTSIRFVPLDTFLQSSFALRSDDTTVMTVDLNNINEPNDLTYFVKNDISPQYYTTFDDRTLLFDAYDAAVDTSGLVGSKSLAYGIQQQTFSLTDAFLPFVDPDFQILLLNEAKSLAFLELKQMEHTKAERTAKREWIHAQHSKRAVDQNRNELSCLPNYGRMGTGYRTTYPYTKNQRSGN